eukprot:Gb_20225 [translate_table: standard]
MAAETATRVGSFVKLQEVCRKIVYHSMVLVFCVHALLLPSAIRHVRPAAEFVFLEFAPGIWNSFYSWLTLPNLYVVLNVVIVTLGVKSRAFADHTSDNECFPSMINNIGTYSDQIGTNAAQDDLKLSELENFEMLTMPAEITLSSSQLCSIEGSMTPSLKLGDIDSCEECESGVLIAAQVSDEMELAETRVLEDGNELTEEEEGEALSAEELYVKAEAFIGNFYRQLSLQRVDSWKRIHGLYAESG